MKSERIFRKEFSFPFVATNQDKELEFALEGELKKTFVRLPNFASNVTGQVLIEDEGGYDFVASVDTLAKNQDHRLDTPWPLAGTQKVKVHLSAALDALDSGTVIVVCYGRKVGI